ncbi:MAG: DUF2085 domain-containing protein [Balneolaceae bacterium]|nr:DUF2085 domain-containing protein [Balneolaceae bacterium]
MFGIKQHIGLYFGVGLLAAGLVAAATGGGLFGSGAPWATDWQHKMFRMLCHQDPYRSFWVNGTPMAVCARCYGVYTGFALFWLGMPLLGYIGREVPAARQLLLAAVFVNLADVIGNVLGFWQNTLLTRLLLGTLIGITAVLLLAGSFIKKNSQTKGEAYGFDGTSEFRT